MKLSLILMLVAVPLSAQARNGKDGAANGRYTTAVALRDNTCGAVTVQPLPTIVTHLVGDTTFTLVHGPLTHRGVLHRDGSFITTPLTLGAAPGAVTRVQVAGRFTATGFTASVSVDETGPRTCGYIVEWTGKREPATSP